MELMGLVGLDPAGESNLGCRSLGEFVCIDSAGAHQSSDIFPETGQGSELQEGSRRRDREPTTLTLARW